ncbi:MAG: tetratricopeptide repeat protein [Verrucomicrobiota bacterium]
MEPPNSSAVGSVAEIQARLRLWCRHAPKGFARLEYTTEAARKALLQSLRLALAEDQTPFTEIELPMGLSPTALVRLLVERLEALPDGVVSIANLGNALPQDELELAKALYAFNFNRENLARPGLRQIWWMSPWFTDVFLRAVPDLNSWFMVRLQLLETLVAPPSEKPSVAEFKPTVPVADARRRSADLMQRFANALKAGENPWTAREQLAAPAIDSLLDAGLIREASDLLDQVNARMAEAKASSEALGENRALSKADAYVLGRRARQLHQLGQYDAAEPLYRCALETMERVLGPEHPDTLSSLNNLAILLSGKGDVAAAESLYRRALETRERVLGPEHPDTLSSLNNLAILLSDKGDLAAAEPLYRRALETSERVLRSEHPDTLASLNNLAVLLRDKGDLAAAEPLYRCALETRERVLGPEHPDTLKSLSNLANLLKGKGALAAAEPLYHRAAETMERVLGPEHPDTLKSLDNLAILLSEKGDLVAAEPLYRRALETAERVLGKTHRDTQRYQRNLAELLAAAAKAKPA